MRSQEALDLIEKIKDGVAKKGIVTDNLVKDLKELRPYAIEEEDPTLTKVIRLTYEHLTEHGTFNIPIPEDDEFEDGEFENTDQLVRERPNIEEDFEAKRESLDYLLALMKNCDTNQSNREDLIAYRNMLMEY